MEEFEYWWENDCASAIRVFINKADAKYIFKASAKCQRKKDVEIAHDTQYVVGNGSLFHQGYNRACKLIADAIDRGGE